MTSSSRLAAAARRGFTLVELLMVIVIIGLLIALVFPAVNSARENGRRTQCINKIQEIAKAVQSFESDSKRYPGWVEYPFGVRDVESASPTYGNSYYATVNYFVPLLPYLGRDDIFSPGNAIGAWKTPKFDGNNPPQTIQVVQPRLHKLTVCPSDFEKLSSTEAELSYVCSSGRHDEIVDSQPWDWQANGVFMDLRRQAGAIRQTPVQKVDASYLRSNDGSNTTLLLSESLTAGWWSTVLDEDATTFHFFPPDPNTGEAPGPDHGVNRGPEYPSSNHPGGVVVVFAGLNSRFVTNEVDFRVWVALNTPNGEHAKEPGSQVYSNNYVRQQPKLTDDNISP